MLAKSSYGSTAEDDKQLNSACSPPSSSLLGTGTLFFSHLLSYSMLADRFTSRFVLYCTGLVPSGSSSKVKRSTPLSRCFPHFHAYGRCRDVDESALSPIDTPESTERRRPVARSLGGRKLEEKDEWYRRKRVTGEKRQCPMYREALLVFRRTVSYSCACRRGRAGGTRGDVPEKQRFHSPTSTPTLTSPTLTLPVRERSPCRGRYVSSARGRARKTTYSCSRRGGGAGGRRRRAVSSRKVLVATLDRVIKDR